MHRIALRTTPARMNGFASIKWVNNYFLWYNHQCSTNRTSEPHHIEAYVWWIAVSVGGSQTIGVIAPASAAYDTLVG